MHCEWNRCVEYKIIRKTTKLLHQNVDDFWEKGVSPSPAKKYRINSPWMWAHAFSSREDHKRQNFEQTSGVPSTYKWPLIARNRSTLVTSDHCGLFFTNTLENKIQAESHIPDDSNQLVLSLECYTQHILVHQTSDSKYSKIVMHSHVTEPPKSFGILGRLKTPLCRFLKPLNLYQAARVLFCNSKRPPAWTRGKRMKKREQRNVM